MATTLDIAGQITAGGEGGTTDANGVVWKLLDLRGWGSPASTNATTQRPRAHGGWPNEPYLTPRVIGATLQARAPSATAMQDALDRLYGAVQLGDHVWTVTDSLRSRWVTGRRHSEIVPDDRNERLYRIDVEIECADPRKYGDQITASTHLPSSIGGLTFPATFPAQFAATVVTGQLGVVNPGNIAAPVKLRVDGPCHGPIITHVGSGQQLVFASSYVLMAGNWLDIDMGRRTVLENGQANRNGFITSRGWFAFDPGDNTVGFNASSYDAGAQLTAFLNPAWM